MKVLYTELVDAANGASIEGLLTSISQARTLGATDWAEFGLAETRLHVLQALQAELDMAARSADPEECERVVADARALRAGPPEPGSGGRPWPSFAAAERRGRALRHLESELAVTARGTSMQQLASALRSAKDLGVTHWPQVAECECRLKALQSLLKRLCEATAAGTLDTLSAAAAAAADSRVTHCAEEPLGPALATVKRRLQELRNAPQQKRLEKDLAAAMAGKDVSGLRNAVVEADSVGCADGHFVGDNDSSWPALAEARALLAALTMLEVELSGAVRAVAPDSIVAACTRADAMGCSSWPMRAVAAQRLEEIRAVESKSLAALAEGSTDALAGAVEHAEGLGLARLPHAHAARSLLSALGTAGGTTAGVVTTKLLKQLAARQQWARSSQLGPKVLHVAMVIDDLPSEALVLRFHDAPWPAPPAFERKLREGLRALGAPGLETLSVLLKEGSIIAELLGPHSVLAALQATPCIDKLTVLGQSVGEVCIQPWHPQGSALSISRHTAAGVRGITGLEAAVVRTAEVRDKRGLVVELALVGECVPTPMELRAQLASRAEFSRAAPNTGALGTWRAHFLHAHVVDSAFAMTLVDAASRELTLKERPSDGLCNTFSAPLFDGYVELDDANVDRCHQQLINELHEISRTSPVLMSCGSVTTSGASTPAVAELLGRFLECACEALERPEDSFTTSKDVTVDSLGALCPVSAAMSVRSRSVSGAETIVGDSCMSTFEKLCIADQTTEQVLDGALRMLHASPEPVSAVFGREVEDVTMATPSDATASSVACRLLLSALGHLSAEVVDDVVRRSAIAAVQDLIDAAMHRCANGRISKVPLSGSVGDDMACAAERGGVPSRSTIDFGPGDEGSLSSVEVGNMVNDTVRNAVLAADMSDRTTSRSTCGASVDDATLSSYALANFVYERVSVIAGATCARETPSRSTHSINYCTSEEEGSPNVDFSAPRQVQPFGQDLVPSACDEEGGAPVAHNNNMALMLASCAMDRAVSDAGEGTSISSVANDYVTRFVCGPSENAASVAVATCSGAAPSAAAFDGLVVEDRDHTVATHESTLGNNKVGTSEVGEGGSSVGFSSALLPEDVIPARASQGRDMSCASAGLGMPSDVVPSSCWGGGEAIAHAVVHDASAAAVVGLSTAQRGSAGVGTELRRTSMSTAPISSAAIDVATSNPSVSGSAEQLARTISVAAVRAAVNHVLSETRTNQASEDAITGPCCPVEVGLADVAVQDALVAAMWSYVGRRHSMLSEAAPTSIGATASVAHNVVCDVLAAAVGHLAWCRFSEVALSSTVGPEHGALGGHAQNDFTDGVSGANDHDSDEVGELATSILAAARRGTSQATACLSSAGTDNIGKDVANIAMTVASQSYAAGSLTEVASSSSFDVAATHAASDFAAAVTRAVTTVSAAAARSTIESAPEPEPSPSVGPSVAGSSDAARSVAAHNLSRIAVEDAFDAVHHYRTSTTDSSVAPIVEGART